MTFRLRHEWTPGPPLFGVARATCAGCHTLRIDDPRNDGPVFMQTGKSATPVEPPCLEPTGQRGRRRERHDRHGCELGPAARARAVHEATKNAPPEGPDLEDEGVIRSRA